MDNIIDMTIIYLDDELKKKTDNRDNISSNAKGKLLAIDCLRCYMQKDDKICRFIENSENHPKLGHLLSVLCNLAKSDKSRQVRLDAINFITELLQLMDTNHKNNGFCTIGMVSFFLPGICSALLKLTMSDDKLPVNLTRSSIQALSKLLQVSLKKCNHVAHEKNQDSNVSEYIIYLKGQELVTTCENLSKRISNLLKYMMSVNTKEEITDEMLTLCKSLIDIHQPVLVTKLLEPILQYVIANIGDSNVDITSKASNIIDGIKTICDNDGAKEFNGILIVSLTTILKELPNICRGSLFSEKRTQLSLLRGYLTCLMPTVLTQTLMIEENRRLLFESLIEIAELSSNQFTTSTDDPVKMISEFDVVSKQNTIDRNFRFLDEEFQVNLLQDCCVKIGEKCDFYTIFDCISTTLYSYNFSPAALFITLNILTGTNLQKGPAPLGSVRGLINSYLNFLSSRYSTWMSDNGYSNSKENSRYIHQITLATETFIPLSQLNTTSSRSIPEKNHFLRVALCQLLNMAASTNTTVSSATLITLEQIAHVYSEKSIQGLIESNVDYIVDTVSSKLEDYAHNNEIPNVIAISFKLASPKMFCFFEDIFERSLRVLDNYYHSNTSLPLVVLFYRIVLILDEWFPQDSSGRTMLSEGNMQRQLVQIRDQISIGKRLSKLRKTRLALIETNRAIEMEVAKHDERKKNLSENMFDDAEKFLNDRQDENLDEEEEKKEKQIPYYIGLVEKIVRRFAHLLSSRSVDIKLFSLKTISVAMRVLTEQENTLLPLAHTVWSPLINLISRDFNKNLEVTRCSFECLVSISMYSKDFIKARTLNDVIPKVCSFLRSQHKYSKNQDHSSKEAYIFSLAYKCLHELLEKIGMLVYHIGLAYSSMWKVIEVVMLYLDGDQPQNLRESARESLLYMFLMDPDCVYYFAKKYDCVKLFPFSEIYLDC